MAAGTVGDAAAAAAPAVVVAAAAPHRVWAWAQVWCDQLVANQHQQRQRQGEKCSTFHLVFVGNRVVAARTERVAARQAPNRQPSAARRAMRRDRLGSVIAQEGVKRQAPTKNGEAAKNEDSVSL